VDRAKIIKSNLHAGRQWTEEVHSDQCFLRPHSYALHPVDLHERDATQLADVPILPHQV